MSAPRPDDNKPGCPFCQRIAEGRYEIRYALQGIVSFEPLNPVTPGHRLFVPARHFEHGNRGGEEEVGRAMRSAEQHGVARGVDFNLVTSSGPAATQTVAHIHVHYVPRRVGDGLHLPWTGQVTS